MAEFFATHFAFMYSAEGWAALITLVAMEVVLGIPTSCRPSTARRRVGSASARP